MFNIFSHKGNANQNDTEIQNSHHQESKQQTLVQMWGKEPSHIAGGNVN
jgi:hypothetical protein